MLWFQRFAGVAFRWSDGPTAEPNGGPTFQILGEQAPATGRVFAIVQ
jgi:hypothetical protein